MCLAVPAKIVSCESDSAVVDLHGNRVQVSIMLVPEAKLDDWVLVHAGFAIKVLDAEDAEETWRILEDLSQSAQEGVADAAPGS
jgi:hydrogenase expression/formation protein HypC